MEREIWRIGKVMKATGLSRTTIWRMEKSRAFPGRVQISARNIGWYSDEIMDFVNQRQRSADTRPQRSSKDVWLSRTTALIGGIFKVVSIVKICLDILGQYKQF